MLNVINLHHPPHIEFGSQKNLWYFYILDVSCFCSIYMYFISFSSVEWTSREGSETDLWGLVRDWLLMPMGSWSGDFWSFGPLKCGCCCCDLVFERTFLKKAILLAGYCNCEESILPAGCCDWSEGLRKRFIMSDKEGKPGVEHQK